MCAATIRWKFSGTNFKWYKLCMPLGCWCWNACFCDVHSFMCGDLHCCDYMHASVQSMIMDFFFMQGLCVVWGAIKSSCLMSILSKLHSLCCLPEYSSLWTSAKLPAITNFQDHNLTLDASPQDLELDAAEMFFYPVHLELNSLACPSTAANHLILNFLGLEVYRA